MLVLETPSTYFWLLSKRLFVVRIEESLAISQVPEAAIVLEKKEDDIASDRAMAQHRRSWNLVDIIVPASLRTCSMVFFP